MDNFLHTLLNSLNMIEVKGKNNMDILLGCIHAVEQKISELEFAKNGGEEEVEDGR